MHFLKDRVLAIEMLMFMCRPDGRIQIHRHHGGKVLCVKYLERKIDWPGKVNICCPE